MTRHDEIIRSRTNPLLKRVGAALAGRLENVLVLEGDRLLDDACVAGFPLDAILVAADREQRARELAGSAQQVRLVEPELLQRVSSLETSQGTIALAQAPASRELAEFPADKRALLLVVAGVYLPGNLGALLRSAEALGTDGVVICRGGVSPWNAKVLRGSMGSALRQRLVHGVCAEDVARHLERQGWRNVLACTRGARAVSEFDWSGPLALWVGDEAGLRPDVELDFEGVSIPMAPGVESLNLGVALSLLMFAADRVRQER